MRSKTIDRVRTLIKVGSDGRVPIGTQRLRIGNHLVIESPSAFIPPATTLCWPPHSCRRQLIRLCMESGQ